MTPIVNAVSVQLFDESSPRYHCCCGCFHVRCGALLIGCLQAVGLFSLLYRSAKAANGFRPEDSGWMAAYAPAVISSLFFFFSLVAVICLFYGLCTQKSKFLTPTLVVIVFSIFYYTCLAVFLLFTMTVGSNSLLQFLRLQLEYQGRDPATMEDAVVFRRDIRNSVVAMIFLFTIGIVFDLWWYSVIRACRTYLEEKEAWLSFHNAASGTNYGLIDRSTLLPRTSPAPVSRAPPQTPMVADQMFVAPPPTYSDVISEKAN